MQLEQAISNVFVQLNDSIDQLTNEQYKTPVQTLSNATIGQHVRHIIELFICLENGYEKGLVNYEKRKRDYTIETNKDVAVQLMHSIVAGLGKPNKTLLLEAGYDDLSEDVVTIETNYLREVVYNLEHTVHHMALIRVGITTLAAIQLPEGYGVASSTIKYRQACAQ
ncbi:DinB family protein [Panacibacter ginsenosidivorans]|uniref:DinB family protein n=1 Tax=Panacibacter ginsenosidivorans TaxID=1813871 RepID=A0A5B8V4D4_9BACT|nr:DinB family protein [Panacibacter ginsenosidivorans]QEC66038.1 DinB family protein [Panacibacter ginsenosidivorans]